METKRVPFFRGSISDSGFVVDLIRTCTFRALAVLASKRSSTRHCPQRIFVPSTLRLDGAGKFLRGGPILLHWIERKQHRLYDMST